MQSYKIFPDYAASGLSITSFLDKKKSRRAQLYDYFVIIFKKIHYLCTRSNKFN